MKKKRESPKQPERSHSLQDIVNTALDFNIGAGVLERALMSEDERICAPGSFVILAALHLELMLKAVHRVHGKTLREHNLLKLYETLPRDERMALQQAYDARRTTSNKLDILEALSVAKDAFVTWRYAYEMRGEATLPMQALKDLGTALDARITALGAKPPELAIEFKRDHR